MQRLNAPDAFTGMQLASSGGGRGTAVAAVVGLRLGGEAGSHALRRIVAIATAREGSPWTPLDGL